MARGGGRGGWAPGGAREGGPGRVAREGPRGWGLGDHDLGRVAREGGPGGSPTEMHPWFVKVYSV